MSEKNYEVPTPIQALLDKNRELAATPLPKDVEPAVFAQVVKARANLILFSLSHEMKLCRDGMDTYANIMAMLYAVGTISDKVPGFNMLEVLAAIKAGQDTVAQLAQFDLLAAMEPKGQA